jgi:hypothetical protein
MKPSVRPSVTPIIFALVLSFSTASFAQSTATATPAPLDIAADAPERHIVVPGDTLWGIAAKFLKDPFRWPELWKMNTEQVKNPHRIYPGQVVLLDMSDGQPQLKLGVVKLEPQVHTQAISKEIPAISPQAIEPFLSQPLVIDVAGFDQAPRIVATQEGRVYSANGDLIYVNGADPQVKSWQVFRPGKPFVDPDSKEVLGLEAIFLGNAHSLGDPADGITIMEITSVKQEIGRGDRLVPASRPEIASYMPHPPTRDIQGRILGLYGGYGEGGRHSIISISRGKQDGLDMGHVLAIHRTGAIVTNRFDDGRPQASQLPDERYGLAFVFRVFDRVSYALVMNAARPVVPGDKVRKP